MFSPVETVCACLRSYAVTDEGLKDHVIAMVNRSRGRGGVAVAHKHDVRSLRASSRFAVNLMGQQCHLVLTRVNGVETCFMVHARSGTLSVVPVRFSPSAYCDTVVKCTLVHRDRVLVLEAVCSGGGSVVHVDDVLVAHTPDAALFPIRIVKRRVVSGHEVLRVIGRLQGRCHSVSLLDSSREVQFRSKRCGR